MGWSILFDQPIGPFTSPLFSPPFTIPFKSTSIQCIYITVITTSNSILQQKEGKHLTPKHCVYYLECIFACANHFSSSTNFNNGYPHKHIVWLLPWRTGGELGHHREGGGAPVDQERQQHQTLSHLLFLDSPLPPFQRDHSGGGHCLRDSAHAQEV